MKSLHLATGLSVLLLAACGGDKPAGPPEVYTVRGIVKGVTGDEVSVQHEAIPAFKDRDGKASEMMSMTMSFGIGEGVDRAPLQADTKVSMTFDVVWDRRPALQAKKIEVLPPDTALKVQ